MQFKSLVVRCLALVALLVATSCSASAEIGPSGEQRAEGSREPDPREWTTVWTARAAAFPVAMNVDDGGVVTGGEEGAVAATDSDGTLQWATFAEGGAVVSSPALVGDVVAVPTTTQVSALERGTGTSIWAWSATEPEVDAGVLRDGSPVVLVAGADGSIAVLDANKGAVRWTTRVPDPAPDATPFVWLHGDTSVVAWGRLGDCCHLVGLDAASGTVVWTKQLAGRSTVPVVHRGLVVFAQNPDNDERQAQVVALDVATGRTAWKVAVRGVYSPGLHGDADGADIAFVDESGAVTLLDGESGSVRWRSRPVYPQLDAEPVVVGDRVALAAFETQALGFDRRSGRLLDKGPMSPPVFVRQEIGHGDRLLTLVTTNGLGAVWAFEPEVTSGR